MPNVETTRRISELLFSLTSDEIVHLVNCAAGSLSARFVSYPDGQPAAGYDYALYDAEAAAQAFAQAARYIDHAVNRPTLESL